MQDSWITDVEQKLKNLKLSVFWFCTTPLCKGPAYHMLELKLSKYTTAQCALWTVIYPCSKNAL